MNTTERNNLAESVERLRSLHADEGPFMISIRAKSGPTSPAMVDQLARDLSRVVDAAATVAASAALEAVYEPIVCVHHSCMLDVAPWKIGACVVLSGSRNQPGVEGLNIRDDIESELTSLVTDNHRVDPIGIDKFGVQRAAEHLAARLDYGKHTTIHSIKVWRRDNPSAVVEVLP